MNVLKQISLWRIADKDFNEREHPRAPEGSTDPKYKGGRFAPKHVAGSATAQTPPLRGDMTINPGGRFEADAGADAIVNFPRQWGNLIVLGADAVMQNIAGERDEHYSFQYPEKYNAFALSPNGAGVIESFARQSGDEPVYIAIAVYPDLLGAMKTNPAFKAAVSRKIAKHPEAGRIVKLARRAYDGETVTLPRGIKNIAGKDVSGGVFKGLTEGGREKSSPEEIAARMMGITLASVAREVGASDFEKISGKIVGIGRYRRVVPKRETGTHPARHEVYNTIVELDGYHRLTEPIPMQKLASETIGDPAKRKYAWLITRSAGFRVSNFEHGKPGTATAELFASVLAHEKSKGATQKSLASLADFLGVAFKHLGGADGKKKHPDGSSQDVHAGGRARSSVGLQPMLPEMPIHYSVKPGGDAPAIGLPKKVEQRIHEFRGRFVDSPEVEYVYAINDDGDVARAKSGSKDRVGFDLRDWVAFHKMGGTTIIHNHSGSSGISIGDVDTAIYQGVKRVVSVDQTGRVAIAEFDYDLLRNSNYGITNMNVHHSDVRNDFGEWLRSARDGGLWDKRLAVIGRTLSSVSMHKASLRFPWFRYREYMLDKYPGTGARLVKGTSNNTGATRKHLGGVDGKRDHPDGTPQSAHGGRRGHRTIAAQPMLPEMPLNPSPRPVGSAPDLGLPKPIEQRIHEFRRKFGDSPEVEYTYAVDNDGNVFFPKSGRALSAGYSDRELAQIESIGRSLTFIHNHPLNTSQSLDDILYAVEHRPIDRMVSIGRGGRVVVSEIDRKKIPPGSIAEIQARDMDTDVYHHNTRWIESAAGSGIQDKRVSVANQMHQTQRNRMMGDRLDWLKVTEYRLKPYPSTEAYLVRGASSDLATKARDPMESLQDSFNLNLERLTTRVLNGEIKPTEFGRQFADQIAQHYGWAWRYGATSTGEENASQDALAVERLVDEQKKYLAGYVAALRAGAQSEAQAYRRSQMYADRLPIVYLHAQLSREGDTLYRWDYDPMAEHCADCQRLNGITKPASYWVRKKLFPGNGVACLGGCRCKLTKVGRSRYVLPSQTGQWKGWRRTK